MIKVQDWIASIPDEEKHIAYVGEGLTEQREFLLCGKGWEQYQAYAFHLDMAFDPASVTTTDSRQVVQTTRNSTEQKEEAAVIIDEVTTKETYTVNDVQMTNHYLSDIAPLSKAVKADGIHLTWTVLRQHTVLPGKLWATIRAVGSESGQIKKSAIMVFEVDPAICAVPSAVPPVSEFEQMERQMDALRMLTETAADDAADAADKATSSADEALRSATTATGAADSALNSMWQALTASDEAQQSADSAKTYVQQAQEATETAASHTTAAEQAASRAQTHQQSAAQHAASAALSNQGALHHYEAALDAAEQCNHSVALCEEYANEAKASARPYRRINVRDYGAVGDGIANDQPAIWEAITAAKALIAEDIPCELHFPAGTYGINKNNGTLTIDGCTIKNLYLTGLKGAVANADEITHSVIQMVSTEGVINTASQAIYNTSSLSSLTNCRIYGWVPIEKEGAIVQGVIVDASNSSVEAVRVSANDVVINGCNIKGKTTGVMARSRNITVSGCRISGMQAIAEYNGVNNNLFIGNMLSSTFTTKPLGIVGNKTIAKNMVNGTWMDNTVTA